MWTANRCLHVGLDDCQEALDMNSRPVETFQCCNFQACRQNSVCLVACYCFTIITLGKLEDVAEKRLELLITFHLSGAKAVRFGPEARLCVCVHRVTWLLLC